MAIWKENAANSLSLLSLEESGEGKRERESQCAPGLADRRHRALLTVALEGRGKSPQMS